MNKRQRKKLMRKNPTRHAFGLNAHVRANIQRLSIPHPIETPLFDILAQVYR